jgi:hypothetical protein
VVRRNDFFSHGTCRLGSFLWLTCECFPCRELYDLNYSKTIRDTWQIREFSQSRKGCKQSSKSLDNIGNVASLFRNSLFVIAQCQDRIKASTFIDASNGTLPCLIHFCTEQSSVLSIFVILRRFLLCMEIGNNHSNTHRHPRHTQQQLKRLHLTLKWCHPPRFSIVDESRNISAC